MNVAKGFVPVANGFVPAFSAESPLCSKYLIEKTDEGGWAGAVFRAKTLSDEKLKKTQLQGTYRLPTSDAAPPGGALEWTMHVAIDEVLGRGEGRAGLTSLPRRLLRLPKEPAPQQVIELGSYSAKDVSAGQHKAHTDGVHLLLHAGDTRPELA